MGSVTYLSLRSLSGNTSSNVSIIYGIRTLIPFKSKRKRLGEFNNMLAIVSSHSCT